MVTFVSMLNKVTRVLDLTVVTFVTTVTSVPIFTLATCLTTVTSILIVSTVTPFSVVTLFIDIRITLMLEQKRQNFFALRIPSKLLKVMNY
jgi:hypothetical protein